MAYLYLYRFVKNHGISDKSSTLVVNKDILFFGMVCKLLNVFGLGIQFSTEEFKREIAVSFGQKYKTSEWKGSPKN